MLGAEPVQILPSEVQDFPTGKSYSAIGWGGGLAVSLKPQDGSLAANLLSYLTYALFTYTEACSTSNTRAAEDYSSAGNSDSFNRPANRAQKQETYGTENLSGGYLLIRRDHHQRRTVDAGVRCA